MRLYHLKAEVYQSFLFEIILLNVSPCNPLKPVVLAVNFFGTLSLSKPVGNAWLTKKM